jgi:hypothetical protein
MNTPLPCSSGSDDTTRRLDCLRGLSEGLKRLQRLGVTPAAISPMLVTVNEILARLLK